MLMLKLGKLGSLALGQWTRMPRPQGWSMGCFAPDAGVFFQSQDLWIRSHFFDIVNIPLISQCSNHLNWCTTCCHLWSDQRPHLLPFTITAAGERSSLASLNDPQPCRRLRIPCMSENGLHKQYEYHSWDFLKHHHSWDFPKQSASPWIKWTKIYE